MEHVIAHAVTQFVLYKRTNVEDRTRVMHNLPCVTPHPVTTQLVPAGIGEVGKQIG